MVECRTFGQGDWDSRPPAAVSKPGQFHSPHFARVFRETLKAVGPFYLVSVPGEVKDPTQGVNHRKCVTCRGLKEWWSLSLTHLF